MKIRFSPKPKTIEKMKSIYKLREQGVIWDHVALTLGHTVRYCQALHEYYLDVVLPTAKKEVSS